MDPILEEVVEENRSEAAGVGMEIKTDLPRFGCKVREGELLQELFNNLIGNSIQHSEGSRIRVSGEEAKLDRWMKEIAPSNELREWFHHHTSKWKSFQDKYREELDQKKDLLEELQKLEEEEGNLTLLLRCK